MKPLGDMRVLAIEQFGAGPFGTLHLVDLGAEVIKIEDPTTGGDVSRSVAPLRVDGDSVFFQSVNRGKRSVALDLRNEEGWRVLTALIEHSDAVFSNLRADAEVRQRLRYEILREYNPTIVCANLSAFGEGPRRAEPGYDYVLQAETGWMDVTGEPDGPPTKTGLSLVDYAGGMVAALSLVAAIHHARRTGVGCDCDLSLYDAALSMLTYPAAWHLNGGPAPTRTRHSSHPSIVPFGAFQTSDGWITVACAKEHFWHRLAAAIGRGDLPDDPRFANMEARQRNREALLERLDVEFVKASTQYWVETLRAVGVPCGPVRTVAEALQDRHSAARQMVVESPHPDWPELRLMATAVRVGDLRPTTTPAPRLGADTEDVLLELLGMPAAAIERLRAAGAFGALERSEA